MTEDEFVHRVMAALPELDAEEMELLSHGIKELFICETKRMYLDKWSIEDAIKHHRLSEHIDCWTHDYDKETESFVRKDEADMIPEDIALERMAKIASKYKNSYRPGKIK